MPRSVLCHHAVDHVAIQDQVIGTCGGETTLCYTDRSGKLITLPAGEGIVWVPDVPLAEAVFTENATVTGVLPGDPDGNGTPETADVVLLMQYLVGDEISLNPTAADFNADGRISIYDAVLLLRTLSA